MLDFNSHKNDELVLKQSHSTTKGKAKAQNGKDKEKEEKKESAKGNANEGATVDKDKVLVDLVPTRANILKLIQSLEKQNKGD